MCAVRVFIGDREIPVATYELPELDGEQLDAGDMMFERGSYLLQSDPGAGKTLTACHAMLRVEEHFDAEDAEDAPRFLIACPPIALRTWYSAIASAYELVGYDVVVQVIDRAACKVLPEATHVIVSYGLLSQSDAGLMRRLADFDADVLICDESDNLVGWDSARTKAVFGPRLHGGGLAASPPWAWFLTGTPIPRYNDGLFPVLKARFAEYLKEAGERMGFGDLSQPREFKAAFCNVRRVKFGKMRVAKEEVCGSRNSNYLWQLLQPISTRIKLKLKDGYRNRSVTLQHKFSKEFYRLQREVFEDGNPNEVDPRLATLLRMMGEESALDTGKYVNDVLKAKRDAADPLGVLVLYWHINVGEAIADMLRRAGWRVGMINGKTHQKNDQAVEDAFNAGDLDVVIGQIKSMGVALNMQKNSDHVIFAEETFSHAMDLQALQRVWRRGQTRPVTVDWVRPLEPAAELKPRVKETKRKEAAKALDANVD